MSDVQQTRSAAEVAPAACWVDATDREQALYDSEAFSRGVFESSPDCVKVLDAEGCLLRMNANGLCAMEIDDLAPLLGHPWAELWPAEAQAEVLSALAAARNTGVGRFQRARLTAKGTPKWWDVVVAPIRNRAGEVIRYVTVSRDVTDRKQAADALASSEQSSRAILESITDGFFTLDGDWRFAYVNPEAERMLRGAPGALLGKVIWDAFPGVLGSEFERVYRHVSSQRVPQSFSAYYPEHARWYDVRAFPSADGLSVYFRDVTEARLAEAALHASEERRRMALDAAELGAWNIDPSGALIADEQFLRIFTGGTAPIDFEEAVAAIHPDDRDRVRAAVAAAIRPLEPAPYELEYRVVHPDGSLHWVFAKGRASFEGQGPARRFVSFDGTVADITGRKEAEDRLRTSEERFRTLFDSMDEGFCVVEMMFDVSGRADDYRVLEMNPAFERHTGLRDVVGRRTREFAPGLEEFWYETYGRVASTGEPIRFTRQARALDGRWFDVYAFRLGDASSRKVAILFNDISARKRAEDQVLAAEQQFRTLADNIPQLAWIADAGTDGQVQWFNKSWLDYTGARLQDMQGAGWHSVHHPEHAERVIAKFAHHVEQGLDWEDTFPLRGKDGSYRWFLSRMNVIRDDSGAVARIFGTNTDISEQREMAARLQVQADELAEADRRKDDFLATLAHELRNPLAPIRNSLQILRLAGDNRATVDQSRAVMERQLAQMVRLVDDLLDVSRISRDKLELRRERVALATVLQSAVETSRPLLDAGNIDFAMTLPAEPIELDADLTRLAQVFVNLLNNAAKFTDRGGRVDVNAVLQAGQVQVTVRDSGIGIAAKHLPRIFEMFSQVDSAATRSQGGLGIGLGLVQRLVEMHGGRVSAHSQGAGQGSRFTVCLPVLEPLPPPARPDPPREDVGPAGLRILVVDDNRDAATSLAALLGLMDHQALAVHDGPAALDAVASWRPDVVLLDIGLPGMSGHDVARRIRAQPGGSEMTLFALTGWGLDDDRERSQQAGFDHHLVKPLDPAALHTLLADVLRPARNR